jgi:peptidoglycan/xylan/chitin deacetylase (PgdA/CDA1 family)
VPVLAYHRFDPVRATGATTVATPTFAAQMAQIVAAGRTVARLRDVAAGAPLPARAVSITADDGHRSVYTEMFPLLKRHGFHATLFLNPPGIGHGSYLRWEELAEMQASGLVECQPHTLSHPDFRAERARRTPADFAAFVRHELAGARQWLREHLGGPQDILAWPYGIHAPDLEEAAREAGYTAAFALGGRAVTPASPRFALPRYQIYEADGPARFGAVLRGVPGWPVLPQPDHRDAAAPARRE